MCDLGFAGFRTQWGHCHCQHWRSMMGQGLLRLSTAQDPMATCVGASLSEPSTDPPPSPPSPRCNTPFTVLLFGFDLSIHLLALILSVCLFVCVCLSVHTPGLLPVFPSVSHSVSASLSNLLCIAVQLNATLRPACLPSQDGNKARWGM